MQQIVDQLQAVRDMLDTADRDPIAQRQIGRILVVLSTLTDLVEQLAADQIEDERDAEHRRTLDALDERP